MNQQQNQTQRQVKTATAAPRRATPAVGDPASVHPLRRQRTQKNQKKMKFILKMLVTPLKNYNQVELDIVHYGTTL